MPLISYYVALTLASSTVFQDHEGQFHIISWITPHGHTLIDHEMYLPACWTDDRLRCQQAGIPSSVPLRTKPELALLMLERLREAHLHADWVVADTVYGGNAAWREWLEEQGQAYVVMVACTEPIVLTLPNGTLQRIEVGDLPALLPQPLSWHRLTTSTSPKGPLTFDWLCFPLWHRGREDGQHFVLLRRFLEEPSDYILKNRITFALVFAPEPMPLPHLVTVVGSRWHIEEDCKNGKHLGMDHYEVRSYRGWHRFLTLVLLSLRVPTSADSAPSLWERQHLLARLFFVLPSGFSLVTVWSAWRQWHGKVATTFHLRRRLKAG